MVIFFKRLRMSPVIDYTKSVYIKTLEADNKYRAIEELAGVFECSDVCESTESLIAALREREEIMSTGIGLGIAIPHAKIDCIREMAFAVGISPRGIDFDSLDGNPVHLIILVVAGQDQHKDYLRLLSNIMAILKNERAKEKIISASSPETILDIFRSESDRFSGR